MNAEQPLQTQEVQKLKEIPKWTRKYTQNRMLTLLVFLIICLFFFTGIIILSFSAERAFRAHHLILGYSCLIILLVAFLLCLLCMPIVCFSISGENFFKWIEQRIYGNEGITSIPEPQSIRKNKGIRYAVLIVFMSCMLGSLLLGRRGYFKIEYMQPIAALYCVPYMVFLYFWHRPKSGLIFLLWPMLYGVHAILIVAGAPMLFKGDIGVVLNMILPLFGYGILTSIIGHLYSRYALKKLKGLADTMKEENDGN